MAKMEFFWDLASPYTYLATTQLAALRERTGAEIVCRPFLLGGLFKSTGNHMPAEVPAKSAWMLHDLRQWADHYGVKMLMPIQEVAFPIRSITAMRVACALPDADVERFMHAAMKGYWADGRDLGEVDVLKAVLTEADFDAGALLTATQDQAVKDKLRANTDEAVARGAFGAPTMFVGDRLFWGNDRLQFVEAALKRG